MFAISEILKKGLMRGCLPISRKAFVRIGYKVLYHCEVWIGIGLQVFKSRRSLQLFEVLFSRILLTLHSSDLFERLLITGRVLITHLLSLY